MKPLTLNYQNANGVRLVTRYLVLQQQDQQWLLLSEAPRLREPAPGNAPPQASIPSSMPALISYVCSIYHLRPDKLTVVISYVPVEQVAYCTPAQLMEVVWEEWHSTLFGPELVGLHWHRAPAERLRAWQLLAAA